MSGHGKTAGPETRKIIGRGKMDSELKTIMDAFDAALRPMLDQPITKDLIDEADKQFRIAFIAWLDTEPGRDYIQNLVKYRGRFFVDLESSQTFIEDGKLTLRWEPPEEVIVIDFLKINETILSIFILQ